MSDDGSQEIIEEYANRYDNIKAILLKEKRWNGGSRNIGIFDEEQTGKYILFIDSDDTIKPNFIELILSIMILM